MMNNMTQACMGYNGAQPGVGQKPEEVISILGLE